jgi:ribosomal protein S18 acetylase RimI-like enzyme
MTVDRTTKGTPDARDPRIVRLSGREALALAARVWPCYDVVFGDVPDYDTWRTTLFERHARRDGYRLVAALEGEEVIGFAWGYVGQPGQYWADLVRDTLPRDVGAQWVGDHFEFVELAVAPPHRRRGLGQALHDQLLEDVRRRCLLSTNDDADDPAVRLYAKAGWEKLGDLRPGVRVMGLDLTRDG